MKQNATKKSPKVAQNFYCELCDYFTCKSCDFKKHLQTRKHKNSENATNATEMQQKVAKNLPCGCGKVFNDRTTLWRHKKKCQQISTEDINKMPDKELIIMLIKHNSQLMVQNTELVDIIKSNNNQQISHINNFHNNNNNNNNKTFNLQFFLNETCKNAMNITDFVNNIKLELDDLETTGRQGYIDGISNIILKNLNKLEQPLRPLHCSDLKREVLYIKDNDEWTKETEEKPILTKAIKTIANENIKQINKWRDVYPDCTKADSMKNDLYLKIVSNSMNGLTKEEGERNINKIINNVAKKVVIEK
jgi:hypothetical protein